MSKLKPLWSLAKMAAVAGVLLFSAWLLVLDIQVRNKFDGRKWALPARVYAQPLEIYNGQVLNLEDLRAHLATLEYRPVEKVSRPGQWGVRGGKIRIYIRAHRLQDRSVDARLVSFELSGGRVSRLQLQPQRSLSLVTLEPALIGGVYPRRQEDRELIRLSAVPPLLGEALIAVEDRDFIAHPGVSAKAIARAMWANLRSGRVIQGGSTITQQLVKNFYLTPRRSLSRKINEALMALLLELHYSKSEILETYMNEVYLGQSGPRQIHGFGLASRHYFRKPVGELNAAEVALLVGLVKGASYYNPWRHPQRARQRRDLVLSILEREGLLSASQLATLQQQPLQVVAETEQQILQYPAFIDLVKRQLREQYSDEDLESEGLSIYTTLSLPAQRRAEHALSETLRQLELDFQVESPSLQGSVLVTALGSGEIEAVVGDRNPRFAGFNRALDAMRPIGSLVKPAIYLTALSEWGGRHLASTVSDVELAVETPNGEIWQPQNFDHQSHGEVLLVDALANSWNQASVRLGMQLGLGEVSATLRNLGVDSAIPRVPAMLLGSLELSPLEVSGMYHTLANDGVAVPLRAIRMVVDQDGEELSRYNLQVRKSLDPDTVALVQHGLQEVMRDGTGKLAYRRLPESLSVAGKTGTSNDQRDSWFAGFSGQHLGVVWLGRDDNDPTPLTGSSGALRVWSDLFATLPTRGLEISRGAGIEYLWVDGATGKLSGENCAGARLLPFAEQRRPRQSVPCRWLRNPVLHWLRKWL